MITVIIFNDARRWQIGNHCLPLVQMNNIPFTVNWKDNRIVNMSSTKLNDELELQVATPPHLIKVFCVYDRQSIYLLLL